MKVWEGKQVSGFLLTWRLLWHQLQQQMKDKYIVSSCYTKMQYVIYVILASNNPSSMVLGKLLHLVQKTCTFMVHSHCPTLAPILIPRPINCNSTQWNCCLSAVWTPPHNSIEPIFYRCLCWCLCRAVWTPLLTIWNTYYSTCMYWHGFFSTT